MATRYVSRAAQDAEHALRDVQARLEGNQYCADCGVSRPEFINLTIGSFVCDICADFHRNSSNRRIKDIFGGDLTHEDVRRMDSVGNDVANRKFLAVWDSREFPPPDRRDRESLREFLWLKYEGIFKKNQTPNPPAPPQEPVSRGYFDSRGYDPQPDRSRRERPTRREQELFRDGPVQPDRQRSYWASRFGEPRAAPQPQPQPHPVSMPYPEQVRRQRDDYYGRPVSAPPYPDRYRTGGPHERFQPPQPTPVVPYGLPRNSRPRYREDVYEEYASNASSRDRERRQSERSSTKPSSQDSYSEGEAEEERREKKKKSSKHSSKSRRKKSEYVESDQEYENDDDYEPDEQNTRTKRSSKKSKKKSSKDGKSRRKRDDYVENGAYDQEDYSSEEEDNKKLKKSSRRKDRDANSMGAEGAGSQTSLTPPVKSEFDLMSEWMGDSKEADNPVKPSPAPAGIPSAQNIPQAMQQAYQTAQMPMMPPMSMYGSVMPMPGGGFMPIMAPPGMMPPPMGMPGMPGMPPLPPGMMGGMPQMPNAPNVAQGGAMPGMPGLINGMHNLNMNARTQPVGATQVPPPPPPMGMPAGPPPGPPPEPPGKN